MVKVMLVAGLILSAIGLVLIPLPGPGLLFLFPGLALTVVSAALLLTGRLRARG
jgi:hypothetical protein